MVEQRRSPMADHQAALAAVTNGVTATEKAYLPMVSLRARTAPTGAPGANRADLERGLIWLGPTEWLGLGEPGAGAADAWDGFDVAVDISGQRTVIELSGPNTLALLSFGCALDLASATVGDAFTTMLALANVTLLIRETGDHPVVWVLVRSSFSGYLAEWLADAALSLND